MEHFDEVDLFLTDHLPRVRAAPKWDMIRYFFKEVKKQQQEEERQQEDEEEEEEEEEEDAGAMNYLQFRQTDEYYRDIVDFC